MIVVISTYFSYKIYLINSFILFSRIDIKRHSKPQDFFLVDSTGDMLETKPILDPNNHFTKKNTTKTDEKPTTTSVSATVKNDKTHVIELSCDVYNNVLSSTESQTLARLVSRKKNIIFYKKFQV